MITMTTPRTAAAERGSSATSTPPAGTALEGEGNSPSSANISGPGHHPKPAPADGRAGALTPTRRPYTPIFPLAPRFTWLVDDEPVTHEVCVVVTDQSVDIIARDALAAAGVDLGTYAYDPDCTVTPYADHAAAAAWSYDLVIDVLSVVDHLPRVVSFLAWLDERMRDLEDSDLARRVQHDSRRYDVDGVGQPRKVPEFFSMLGAARILSRDSAISITRTGLFRYLETIGWIRRDGNVWAITDDIPARGLLAVQQVSVPNFSTTSPYEQVIVSVAGLRELRVLLGGIAELDLGAS